MSMYRECDYIDALQGEELARFAAQAGPLSGETRLVARAVEVAGLLGAIARERQPGGDDAREWSEFPGNAEVAMQSAESGARR